MHVLVSRVRVRSVVLPSLLVLSLGTACRGDDTSPPSDGADDGDSSASDSGADTGEPETPTEYDVLPPQQRLLRASMALRGTRPSLEEYEAVAEDPEAYATLVDGYLASPAFGEMVRQHFTEWMELDQAPDSYPAAFPPLGAFSGMGTHEFNTSIIQAAGRLAEHIVLEDRPWSDIVTADYTLADEVVATVWGLPYDAGQGGWQVTEYTDGRPAAGVLSDGWVFTRMPSTENNRHRERASLIANALICHDYPGRPVLIPPDLDLTSEDAITNAIETNDVCVGCHHTLDPLASFFTSHFALRIPEYETSYPLVQYTPDAGAGYEPPAWYGVPANDLGELGVLIADDPRFDACAIRRFYSELMHVEVEAVPQSAISAYLPGFRDSDRNVRALVREIVLSDAFAATGVAVEGTPAPEDVGLRRATPQQLDSLFVDLVGYQWRADVTFDLGVGPAGSVPLMRDYLWGYRTMAGGPNNFDTTTHLRTADPGTVLTLRALAERAARETVAHDAADPDAAFLLTVPGALAGDSAAVDEQLAALHLRLFGQALPTDDPQIVATRTLFDSAFAQRNAERAWEITLAALFQDPGVLFY